MSKLMNLFYFHFFILGLILLEVSSSPTNLQWRLVSSANSDPRNEMNEQARFLQQHEFISVPSVKRTEVANSKKSTSQAGQKLLNKIDTTTATHKNSNKLLGTKIGKIPTVTSNHEISGGNSVPVALNPNVKIHTAPNAENSIQKSTNTQPIKKSTTMKKVADANSYSELFDLSNLFDIDKRNSISNAPSSSQFHSEKLKSGPIHESKNLIDDILSNSDFNDRLPLYQAVSSKRSEISTPSQTQKSPEIKKTETNLKNDEANSLKKSNIEQRMPEEQTQTKRDSFNVLKDSDLFEITKESNLDTEDDDNNRSNDLDDYSILLDEKSDIANEYSEDFDSDDDDDDGYFDESKLDQSDDDDEENDIESSKRSSSMDEDEELEEDDTGDDSDDNSIDEMDESLIDAKEESRDDIDEGDNLIVENKRNKLATPQTEQKTILKSSKSNFTPKLNETKNVDSKKSTETSSHSINPKPINIQINQKTPTLKNTIAQVEKVLTTKSEQGEAKLGPKENLKSPVTKPVRNENIKLGNQVVAAETKDQSTIA